MPNIPKQNTAMPIKPKMNRTMYFKFYLKSNISTVSFRYLVATDPSNYFVKYSPLKSKKPAIAAGFCRILNVVCKTFSVLRTGKNDGLLHDRISYVQQHGYRV